MRWRLIRVPTCNIIHNKLLAVHTLWNSTVFHFFFVYLNTVIFWIKQNDTISNAVFFFLLFFNCFLKVGIKS